MNFVNLDTEAGLSKAERAEEAARLETEIAAFISMKAT
tara:strand:- start:4835 stop:4948 length:114 start_codon:yes stop_codon:yes gene_type:complete